MTEQLTLGGRGALDARPVAFREAKAMIERGHYLGTAPTCSHAFGLFADGGMVGAAIFDKPVRENVARSLWREPDGAMARTRELTRFYTLDGLPPNTGTWFLARAVDGLPPEYEMIVAFSDPLGGHFGGLYQAASWIYTGRTRPAYHYVDESGKRIGKKTPWRIAVEGGLLEGERPTDGEARVARERGWTKVPGERKYRYVKPRTRRARRSLALRPMPYPKPRRRSQPVPARSRGL